MARATVTTNEERPVRMLATKARGGFLDRDILAVLIVSTALAMIVLFAALAIQSSANHLERQGPQTRLVEQSSGESTAIPPAP